MIRVNGSVTLHCTLAPHMPSTVPARITATHIYTLTRAFCAKTLKTLDNGPGRHEYVATGFTLN